MDTLSQLPERNTIHTSEESEVMSHFFGDKKQESTIKNIQWKKIAAITVAFLILANPITSKCVSIFPAKSGFPACTILFVIATILILMYL